MLKILHFADAHIDVTSYGRHDPQTGLPLRTLDFLKALDLVVDTAISENVDMVLFAGDAYKNRTPVPTFQREWGRRIIRLSQAGILTLILVGNHDVSPAVGRAHALQEFETLQVPNVRVLSRPALVRPDELNDLPVQVIAFPWISRSGIIASLGLSAAQPGQIYETIEERITQLVHGWLDEADPKLPTVFTAHASVQGAHYGSERSVMLGNDLVLPGSLVRDKRFDYVALGHIHKAQNLHEDAHPPVIYPGSIERVDFGEAGDKKYFVIAYVERGKTEVSWHEISGRTFVDRYIEITRREAFQEQLYEALAPEDELMDAVVRLTVAYPRTWEADIDEQALYRFTGQAFEFHFVRRPQMDARLRLPEGQMVSSLSPLELLEKYWKTLNIDDEEAKELQNLAVELLSPEDDE